MSIHQQLMIAAVCTVFVMGCGGDKPQLATETTPTKATAQGPTTPATIAEPTGESTPAALTLSPDTPASEVVLAFLNAMRDGNSAVASELLTDMARAETAKHQWPVEPPGAPSATYQLGQPSFVDQSQTGVHIPCIWAEPDGAGGTIQFEVVWALRRLDAGWRVAGFAAEIVPGKAPYFFNFEDIANLKETRAMAEAALAEASGAQQNSPAVAERPATAPTTTR